MRTKLISQEVIKERILIIREQKVMIDQDLALLYGVQTKRLNEQVKRNKKRFPEDFMFRLTRTEMDELVAKCDRFEKLKYSSVTPCVFTEQGVAMLSSVLKSERAIKVNLAIMRTFVYLRQTLAAHKELAEQMKTLEQKVGQHDRKICSIFEVIRKLMEPPPEKPKKQIGFHV